MPETSEVTQIELMPRIGMIVGYVLPKEAILRTPGKIRPAIVVEVSDDCVNLQVFTDGFNDVVGGNSALWAHSVKFNPDKAEGTWHWLFEDMGSLLEQLEPIG